MNVRDPNSSIKAMLVCRVVIGKEYETYQENQAIRSPPRGYDCVGQLSLPTRVHPSHSPFFISRVLVMRCRYVENRDGGATLWKTSMWSITQTLSDPHTSSCTTMWAALDL